MAPLMNTDDFGVEQSAKDTKHDLITTIGYTIPAADGGNIDMNDLSWEKPAYRDARQVRVHDVRGAEEHFSIDEHGFQYYKLPFIPGEREIDFANSDDPNIKDIHYKGMADWSAKHLGAKEVIIYNHIIRGDFWHPQQYDQNYRGPAMRPHIDVSPTFARTIFQNIWKAMDRDDEKLEEILSSGTWTFLNMWRPLQTVKRDALALLDTRSVSSDDIYRNTHERDEGIVVESCFLGSGLKPEEPDNMSKHKWYFMHEQKPNEIALFKMFDARPGATSSGTPHTAVHIPGSEDEPARRSIEMRAIVLY